MLLTTTLPTSNTSWLWASLVPSFSTWVLPNSYFVILASKKTVGVLPQGQVDVLWLA